MDFHWFCDMVLEATEPAFIAIRVVNLFQDCIAWVQ